MTRNTGLKAPKVYKPISKYLRSRMKTLNIPLTQLNIELNEKYMRTTPASLSQKITSGKMPAFQLMLIDRAISDLGEERLNRPDLSETQRKNMQKACISDLPNIIKNTLTKVPCPKCHETKGGFLRPFVEQEIEIDLCTACGALYLDQDEFTYLANARPWSAGHFKVDHLSSEEIDELNSVTNVPCPSPDCEGIMKSITYPESEVIVEACPSCKGILFDNGEYSAVLSHYKLQMNENNNDTYEKLFQLLV